MPERVPGPCTPTGVPCPPHHAGWAGCGGSCSWVGRMWGWGQTNAARQQFPPQLLPPPPPGHVLSAWAPRDYFPFFAEGHLKSIAMDLSCITPFSCPPLQPRTESLPSTHFCKAWINSEQAPLNANSRPLALLPLLPNPHPNFSPRAQTPPAAIDVSRASASPAQPDSTWGEEGNLKGPVAQGLLGYRRWKS